MVLFPLVLFSGVFEALFNEACSIFDDLTVLNDFVVPLTLILGEQVRVFSLLLEFNKALPIDRSLISLSLNEFLLLKNHLFE